VVVVESGITATVSPTLMALTELALPLSVTVVALVIEKVWLALVWVLLIVILVLETAVTAPESKLLLAPPEPPPPPGKPPEPPLALAWVLVGALVVPFLVK
jgi:hypothetical protein